MLRRYTEAIELRQKSITESHNPALSAFALLNGTEYLINHSNFQEVAGSEILKEEEDFSISGTERYFYLTQQK